MRKAKKNGNDLWEEDYFIDISSRSGEPTRSAGPSGSRPDANRPAPSGRTGRKSPRPVRENQSRDSGFWEEEPRRGSSGRPQVRRNSGGPESRRNPMPPGKKQSRATEQRPKGKAHKLMLVVTLLVMAAVTVLLCVFLLFKVSEIEVTGDQVYDNAAILNICGYKVGDNLFFVSTTDKEERLKQELPYIQEVKISRHIPGTLEINITGAKVAACVSSGGTWLYASGSNKVLEKKDAPKDGVLQVVGLNPLDSSPGAEIKVEDEGVQQAFQEIMGKIVELDASSKFTKLDLTDIHDIKLWYEGRVEFKLGSAVELAYKIEFGYYIASDANRIGSKETGTLDLSYAEDVKRASFTVGTGESSSSSGSASSQPGTSSSESGRGGEIPDAPFTGSSTADSGSTGDSGDTGDAGDTGGSDGTGADDVTWDTGDGDITDYTDTENNDTGDTWDETTDGGEILE